jgi:hypothetical protein
VKASEIWSDYDDDDDEAKNCLQHEKTKQHSQEISFLGESNRKHTTKKIRFIAAI